MSIIVTADNFEKEVSQAEIPVLLDFHADWCSPCKALHSRIEEIAEEYQGRVKVGFVNIDDNTELSTRFFIANIPLVMLFYHGQEQSRFLGLRAIEDYREALDSLLDER